MCGFSWVEMCVWEGPAGKRCSCMATCTQRLSLEEGEGVTPVLVPVLAMCLALCRYMQLSYWDYGARLGGGGMGRGWWSSVCLRSSQLGKVMGEH